MSKPSEEAKAIFFEAIEITSQDELGVFLDSRCGSNAELRDRVEKLLVAKKRAGYLLGGSFASDQTAEMLPMGEKCGDQIGPYTLMEQIGEGGMGTVFVAQQSHPIRRKVALKLIKPGMDTKSVIARFEAERQALAMMEHPNIAKVLDAGSTESGRPYFAMELVKGISITHYCDQNRLTIGDRLELFGEICKAIQHAHQKGIIHRDIKPSNVLVTLHDGKPIPKVIDFGVAKAMNARLSNKTIYTEHFQVVGTLLYMSPEQAELSGLDVDTRSDVYSLGVLLYELLTGTTPFQQHELEQAGFDEQRRIIRDCEPPRASVRISSLRDTATAVAEARKTDLKKLQESIKGDLDWIIFKGLEKDRTRRYESAGDFGRDISRFLAKEAVLAHPPSAIYRARKFASKYRAAIGAVTCVVFALSVGMGIAFWNWRVAVTKSEQLERAIKNGVDITERLQASAIESAWTAAWFGDTERVKLSLDGIRNNPAYEDELLRIEGLLLYVEGHLESARQKFETALSLNDEDFFSQAFLATTAINAGESGQFAIECTKLDSMTPVSDYDQLALASVEVFRDPYRALKIVKRVGSGARGVGKLFVRTEANIHAGYDSGLLEYCDKGLEDIERLELILGKSSNTLCVRLLNLTFAYYISKVQGDLERSHEYAELAKAANEELIESKYDDSLAHSIQWHYYQYGPEPDKELAWKAIKRVSVDADYVINIATERLLNEPDPLKGLRDFDQLVGQAKTPYAKFARALLMSALPDRAVSVKTIADDLASKESVVFRRFSLFLYALLGEKESARSVASGTLGLRESRFMGREKASFEAFLAPEKFNGFATLGHRRRLDFTLSELTRGLIAISQGNRTDALNAFQSARKSQLRIYYLDMYAAAFENQLKTNPDWPCGRALE